jgi:flavin reductase
MQRADPLAFRQAASRFATGVAVLTALDRRGEACGMTANSFVSISLSPPTVLVSVKPGRTHDAITAIRRYGVNVLPEQAKALSKYFADRSREICPDYEIVAGLPRLSNCVAFFACEVVRTIDVNDHTLFIAEVSGCDYCDSLPLVFFSSRYHLGPGEPLDL